MKSTQYLYGIDPKILAHMNYVDALTAKIDGAFDVMAQCSREGELLLKGHPQDSREYDDIMSRYLAAQKAVKFNRKLLEEIYEK